MSRLFNQLLFSGKCGEGAPVIPESTKYDVLVLPCNTAGNDAILDSSTNNFTCTQTGNVAQGTFSPFGDKWSTYFDGSTDVTIADNTNLRFDADFTIELWVRVVSTSGEIFAKRGTEQSGATTYTTLIYSGNFVFAIDSQGWGADLNYGAVNFGMWQHLAISREGSNVRCFVDGVLGRTITFSGTNVGANTSPFSICKNNNPSGAITYVSNLRLVKGTALYTANFTPSTTPLTAITNTQLLTCNSGYLKDQSSNNLAITATGTPKTTRYSPFNLTAEYSASTIGGSMYFDGSSYGAIAGSTDFDLTGDFTIEFWVYPTQSSGTQAVCSIAVNGSLELNLFLRATSFYDGVTISIACPSWVHVVATMATVNLHCWTHIAVTKDAIFYNGISQTLAAHNPVPAYSLAGGNLVIGRSSPDYSTFFVGGISNFRYVTGTTLYTSNFTVPTTPLSNITNTKLLLHGTNTLLLDWSENTNVHVIGSKTISTSVKAYGTGSLYFNGSTDHAIVPHSKVLDHGLGDFTLEFNLYMTTLASYQCIFSRYASWQSSLRYYMRVSNGVITLWIGNGPVLTANPTPTISTNTWYHIALTRSAGVFRFFINGTVAYTSASTTISLDDSPLYIGASSDLSEKMTGYIDSFRISNGIARYTTNFTPSTPPYE